MKINRYLDLCRISVLDFLKRRTPIHNNSRHLDSAFHWLCCAQDSVAGGGVSEGYHLYYGWLPPYPETTGYIIETFFEYYHITGNPDFKERALRMTDWLISIQDQDGAIPDSYFKKKMIFDTGQVIFGLTRSYQETGLNKYKMAAEKAGQWLLKNQETDGSWVKYTVDTIPHTYYSRVAWSLLELHKITSSNSYLDFCIRNIEWCLKQQSENGWFDKASFNVHNHHRPFTHTIAYTIDGILEAGLHLKENRYIRAVQKTLDNILSRVREDGFVPGTYDKDWNGDTSFSCLTGSSQLAINFLKMYSQINDDKYFDAARMINSYVKSKQDIRTGNKIIRGGIAGSYPIWGKYIHFNYPNWAAKFFCDSLILEEKLSKKPCA
jgi:uncharacterized protein YyaL (SSP411 family)